MKGDFTRSTFDRRKHYNTVLTQQGRLPMDADWNENQDILAHLDETTRVDVIGPCGFPEDKAGFELAISPEGVPVVGIGRGYVGGILCENENADPADETPVPITAQPDLPGYALPEENGIYVAYLDVWKRHITALEDPNIKEIALGNGPDTATRLQTICQVKLVRVSDSSVADPPTCEDFGPDWQPADRQGTSQLRSRAEPDPLASRPCIIPAQAGYRRLENQLYRVEIHQGSEAEIPTFKWSRDNGSIVSGWSGPDTPNTDKLTVDSLGRDSVLRFRPNQWVELSDSSRELSGTPGRLVQLAQADGQMLELDNGATASRSDFPLIPKVRRWDHQATVARPEAGNEISLDLVDGAVPIVEGAWILLEEGVQVWFEPGSTYHTGDCWMIPARTIGADVLWPKDDSGEPLLSDPHCIRHHYCAIGLIAKTAAGWELQRDCRPLFPPLTELPNSGGCCLRVEPGEDVQRAIDSVIALGGGCLCLGHGVHTVEGPLRLFNARNISISGETPTTTLRLVGTDSAGLGGIVLRNAARINFRQLFMLGQQTPAVIHLSERDRTGSEQPNDSDDTLETNFDISLRASTLVNRSNLEGQPPTCAILANDARQVRLESTRLIARIGILSRLGDQLPDYPTVPDEEISTTEEIPTTGLGRSTGGGVSTIDFSEAPVGSEFRLNETYPTPVAAGAFRPFVNQGNQAVNNGTARIIETDNNNSSEQWLQLESISFQLNFSPSASQIAFSYFHGSTTRNPDGSFPPEGNLNVAINGNWNNLRRMTQLDGQVIDGVRITVQEQLLSDIFRVGTVLLSGPVNELRIGGQNLSLRQLRITQPSQLPQAATAPQVPAHFHLQDVTILYQRYGIWAVAADSWEIHRSTIRPIPETSSQPASERISERPAVTVEGPPPSVSIDVSDNAPDDAPDDVSLASAPRKQLRATERLMNEIERLLQMPSTVSSDSAAETAAIKAFLWDKCLIEGSKLLGDRAAETAWWFEGAAHNNIVTSQTLGLYSFWQHKGVWSHNQVSCQGGSAFAWVGSYRTEVFNNRVRDSLFGIATIEADEGLSQIAESLQEIRAFYTSDDDALPLVSWVLLTQIVPRIGLASLVSPLQQLLNAVNIPLPVLYYLGRLLYPALTSEENSLSPLFSALIGLQLTENDIEASDTCVRCQDFWTLGGLTLRDNRLHTLTGQALLLEANALAVNTHLVGFVWRYVMSQLTQKFLPQMLTRLQTSDEPLAAVTLPLIRTFNLLLENWAKASERFLEMDYRVESNRIRSLETAIATNLFEINLLNNHITLQESPVSLKSFLAAVETLSRSAVLAPLALALKNGSGRELSTATEKLKTENTFANTENRTSAVQVLSVLNSRNSQSDEVNVPLQAATTNLITTLSSAPSSTEPISEQETGDASAAALDDFTQALASFVDSYGILLEGIGGRLVGNHILVPADTQRNTWSRGGIRLSSNLRSLYLFVLAARLLQKEIFSDNDDDAPVLDPLLGITETLVDNNEILGGIGHGIDIRGNDVLEILFKLKLRDNQIGGMGGAGIFVDEDALAVNLDIEGNRMADCANQPDIAAMMTAQGGLDVEGALFCRIQQNRINACGSAELRKVSPYAVNLKNIFDLTFTGNSVQYNPTGGVGHENVFGTVSFNNNEISQNRGIGFSWENANPNAKPESASPATDDSPETGAQTRFVKQAISPEVAIAQFNQLTNQSLSIQSGQVFASIQNNQFHVPDDENALAFRLIALSELIFSGNSASRMSSDPVGLLAQIGEGVVTSNLLRNRT
ncbi:MAG: DUF6519 domain-containing protein [Cyanobacteria bacterium J06626_6]